MFGKDRLGGAALAAGRFLDLGECLLVALHVAGPSLAFPSTKAGRLETLIAPRQ